MRTDWIRTADKLPAHTDEVLAFDPGEGVVVAYHHNAASGGQDRWSCDHIGTISPTHWMPMPEPPNIEEKSE